MAPQILLFGSLALSFDNSAFKQLRQIVLENHDNVWLADVIRELPQTCEIATSSIPFLQRRNLLAREQITDLRDAFIDGRSLTSPLPNALLIPLNVIGQLSQYCKFVHKRYSTKRGCEADPHTWISRAPGHVEALGLCTGLLAAFTASSARSADEFRQYGATAIRLGLLIGLAVDSLDAESTKGRSRSLTVAWVRAEGLDELKLVLEKFSEDAYISVYYDNNRVTINAPATQITDLSQKLRARGFNVSEIGLFGAFHASRNAEIASALSAFCSSNLIFELPDASILAASVRSADDSGSLLQHGSLTQYAIQSILVEPPRWFDTVCAAIGEVASSGEGPTNIVNFGYERSVPPSFATKANIHIHPADDSLGPEKRSDTARPWLDSDIAVVGMSCKVSGADNLEEFWNLLMAGKSQHRDISKSSRFSFDDNPFRSSNDHNMSRKWFANLIDGHDQFDHRFFKKTARDSATMDPQQRHILQIAYQAVEQSGYFNKPRHTTTAEREKNDRNIGCFVGVCLSDYDNNVACHAANAFTATGNLQGFIAGKISHFFGWTGPGLTIDTACSSSLVAIHQACVSILSGECTAALAGGSHIMTSASWFQNLAAGSFLSPTGACKPFDAAADGYCRGEGVGAVFLKKMSAAVEDGDQILGVIASTAVQQNQNITPIFVPNTSSLSDLLSNVTQKARIRPSQVSYVEAHGTGTPVGDPAEYNSIRQVFGGQNRRAKPLVVSSVKGLVGHMECTSGIISLIKVLLMLNKGIVPPQASFSRANPALQSKAEDLMSIPAAPQPWDSPHRIAVINNYGASGSNASMVVMQAKNDSKANNKPGVSSHNTNIVGDAKYPFWLGGLDRKSLRRYISAFRSFLARSGGQFSVADISFHLAHQNNRTLDQGLIFSAKSTQELEQALTTFEHDIEHSDGTSASSILQNTSSLEPTVILCFGGQVSTFVGLDPHVYDTVAILKKHLDHVDAVVQSLGNGSIFPDIFQYSTIPDVVQLQIVLFAMQYACARSWIDCGVRPAALVGHSFGELTALCVSQVLSLEDTVKMIRDRAVLVRDLWGAEKGAMIAIEADQQVVERLLSDVNSTHSAQPASIACYNGPRNFTVAGTTAAIDDVATRAQELGQTPGILKSKRINVTNAFHSVLVDAIVDRLESGARSLDFRKPSIFLEAATEHSSSRVDLTAKFVANHMRKPVYFNHAIHRLAEKYRANPCVFLEAGSNSTVTAMASRALANAKGKNTFHSVSITNCRDGFTKLTDTTLSLWKAGLRVQHWAHHGSQRQSGPSPLILPPYQFDPESRHWLELKALPSTQQSPPLPGTGAVESQERNEGFLTLWKSRDGPTHKQAIFLLNSSSEKYGRLLSGHLTIKTAPICPATVQLAFVIDAVSTLHPEYRQALRQPQIHSVKYHSPVCANQARTTWIEVIDATGSEGAPKWQFEVFSTENSDTAQPQTRISHTTGQISFNGPDCPSVKHQLVLFERLFGHDRATELLESADVDEILTNRNIYRIFAEIVDYGEEFRGLQKLVSRRSDVAGHVIRKKNNLLADPDQDPWFDAHLSDTFCQLGGLFINCMADRSPDEVYLANGIDQWVRAPVKEQRNEFHVFARNHQSSERVSKSDVFVFDAKDGSLLEVILGIAYVRIPKLSMERMLTRLTEPTWLAKKPVSITGKAFADGGESTPNTLDKMDPAPASVSHLKTSITPRKTSEPPGTVSPSMQEDLSSKVKTVIADLSGLELSEIRDDSELADLGIDSLVGMELIHELETAFGIKLPEEEAFAVVNMPELIKCVSGALGVGVSMNAKTSADFENDTTSNGSSHDDSSMTTVSDHANVSTNLTTPVPELNTDKLDLDFALSGPIKELNVPFATVINAFDETKALTDAYVVELHQGKYITDCFPLQNELAVALTIEAFEAMDAGLAQAQPGQRVRRIPHKKEHSHLVTHLYRMLQEETQIIKIDGEVITRTAVPIPQKSTGSLYREIHSQFPDQDPATQLIQYAGSNLQQVLSGEIDGVKLIFGNQQGRDLASAFYADWPLNRIMYSQMKDFLTRLLLKLQEPGHSSGISETNPFRILEMGAGTGGTTKQLVSLIAELQVPVEYTFTDLSPSFVAAARKRWGTQAPWMRFRVHDIEKTPQDDLLQSQHLVIASNAIHATKSISKSTANVHRALRPDGFFLMLEMTRRPYWVDLIFGLFEGWWRFEDGRRHVLTHESRWKTDMQAVGYGVVDWTGGTRPETDIEKLILAAACPDKIIIKAPQVSKPEVSKWLGPIVPSGASSDCIAREQAVAKYVRELTQELSRSISNLPAPYQIYSGVTRSTKSRPLCVLVTGATGGLGTHLVADAAMRDNVNLVICLNRRSKQVPLERQLQSLRKKGIDLPRAAGAKLLVLETDLSVPTNLGLPNDTYQFLVDNVTHIVHNAWLMHSKWTVKRFEPQLHIMANMLQLAVDVCAASGAIQRVTFELVSSIATVGHHPLWTRSPIVPEERVSIESVLPTGYGDAKYICERMLDATLHHRPELFRPAVVRLGQIAGSRTNGHWNPMEHVSFMIKSSQTLSALPSFQGTMGWTPTDDVACTLLDILTQPEDVTLYPVYHIENSLRQPWNETIAVLADSLNIPDTGIIPVKQWLQLVRNWPKKEDNNPNGSNPAYLLVDFLESNFDRMSCGGLLMGTAHAREHSPCLAALGAVNESLTRLYIQRWKDMGFLSC